MPEITLKVDSAYPEDQGNGKARLDPSAMQALNVSPGDLVRITGKTSTVAKVWRSFESDWNMEKIRIDKYTRANASVNPGDRVTVEKVEEEIPATSVTLVSPSEISAAFPDEEDDYLISLINFPVSLDDIIPIKTFHPGPPLEFKVSAIEPENACILNKMTELVFNDDDEFDGTKAITYEDIGGLKGELKRVREMIELPIRHPELFETMGIEPPKGVLLYGPPGTGKTLIAKAVANESGAHFISIAGPEIISKYYGESEQKLREIFEEAEEEAPSIIFIDELDSIAPKREDVNGEVERRVVAQLLTMLDGITDRGQVIVIGATNRPDAIDPALRRPGRFDREIEIGVPAEADRMEILQIHTKDMPFEGMAKLKELRSSEPSETVLEKALADYEASRDKLLWMLASQAKGFVGADLAALAREAAIRALRRQIDVADIDNEKIPEEVLRKLEVTTSDFILASREVAPSAMREIALETADVSWTDIGGSRDAVRDVRESVEFPLTRKEVFAQLGIRPPKGVLLYGPPGTGKTMIAKAVAHESGANFIAVKGPELLSKWVGESEKAVRDIFKKARQVAPAIIFFDELDSLTPSRGASDGSRTTENVLNQILTEMDGIEELNDVMILAASNRPDIIDPALLRSGRFDRLVYISEPEEADRKEILAVHMQNMPIEGSSFDEAVKEVSGLNEASLESLGAKFSGKSVTIKQIKTAAGKYTKGTPLSLIEERRRLAAVLRQHAVTLSDPEKTKLIRQLAEDTAGYVGSDLEGLCREAAMHALRNQANVVTADDFAEARKKIHPTMNERVREYYISISQRFKGGLPKEAQNLIEYQ
ncbi:AAA family ATPase, CDC48 subfamily [Methanocorpusculum labreanum Z]|uniref:AAA family ATPase, CDC48 subfamily n=1 Tax=Methanocorpusculum labreanum (strain ATCC 43576 / DSM 4855 / Z) TaxID=410358 RepID=A2SR43_METLZ|nr:CDC48 family AAA ATPase [Methanocorpusculum labreanum]ABN06799.1 AAA family ATPase, CDC48 subfamily [Methanocorpusculum labreanum Z]